jgi:hypothetical protein
MTFKLALFYDSVERQRTLGQDVLPVGARDLERSRVHFVDFVSLLQHTMPTRLLTLSDVRGPHEFVKKSPKMQPKQLYPKN